MIIHIKLKPGAKKEEVVKISDTEYHIALKEPARDNKANLRLINILSKQLKIPFSRIDIKNPTSRNKIIEIKS